MPSDSELRTELERVLGEQMQIIQEQQAQATRVIRVSLTTAGLLLTLVSIAASSGVVNLPTIGGLENKLQISMIPEFSTIDAIMFLIGLIFIIAITFIFMRIFAPALAVLSPDAAHSAAYRYLMNFPPFTSRKRSARELLEDDSEVFDGAVTLRTGLDAEKAEQLINSDDVEEEIIKYHIGCVKGNEAIIKTNRRHLTEIYRSAATASFLLIGLLLYALMGSIFLLS